MEKDSIYHQILQAQVENFVGYKMQTRRHFDMLSASIYEVTKFLVSPTTLRRFFGYQEGNGGVSLNTLNVLSAYIGYENWETFKSKCLDHEIQSSDFVCQLNNISVETLHCGDTLLVSWAPSHSIIIEFLGHDAFRVLESKNSKLVVNDTFHCKQFVEGMPLFCDTLLRVGCPAMSYVCGKDGGIHFSVIQTK